MYKKNSYSIAKTFLIIVCYKTNFKQFNLVLKNHLLNFNNIIIVNNDNQDLSKITKSKKITLINNYQNVGLAKGINIGINEAIKRGANLVSIFDQDSLIPTKFFSEVLNFINNYKKNKSVAVFAPVYFNKITDESSAHVNLKPFRLIREKISNKKNYVNPHYVITSGSLIPTDVLIDVGLMREELFIDFIDIEWCLRARKKNYEIVAMNNIMITHHLGDYAVRFLGRRYPIHSPLRMYYFFRNAIYLYRLREIDWNWRFVDATRNLLRFLFFMLMVKDRPTYFKYIIKGYYHGLIKKMGKLEE